MFLPGASGRPRVDAPRRVAMAQRPQPELALAAQQCTATAPDQVMAQYHATCRHAVSNIKPSSLPQL